MDIYRSFPHPSLFRRSGRDPPLCVLQKFRGESFVIKNFVNRCHVAFKFALSDFAEQRPPSPRVIWHGGCVHEFLNTQVIVASDKDGDQVVMSLKTYLIEQNNNVGVVHKNEDPVYRKLGDFTTNQKPMWTNQAKVWRRDIVITAITLLEFHNVDEPLTELLQNFFERSPLLKMPFFYMPVKTYKRKSIHQNSWPSRPITALKSWFTTPPSIILSTLGKMFFRFDAWQDTKNTPLGDTPPPFIIMRVIIFRCVIIGGA